MGERLPLDLDVLRARLADETGPRLWRSLEEIADLPEIRRHLEAEFPDVMRTATIDRRTLLRLMGASLALGTAACREPDQAVTGAPLLSQGRNQPGHIPGTPLAFATSLGLNGYGRGVLVKTQEGRPIKIEGNPLHPGSLGATDVFAQAEILSLYDPDRSAAPLSNGVERTFDDVTRFLGALRDDLVRERGRGLHLLMEPTSSPTLRRLVSRAREHLPEAHWHAHTPIDDENRRTGSRAIFGREIEPVYQLSEADVIVTLGGDLFFAEPGHVRYAADYLARRRSSDRPLPRLVAVESSLSLVGARADERIVLRPRDMEAFTRDLASLLDTGAAPSPEPHPAAARIADALRGSGNRGLVAAGREQPASIHTLALVINARLGAFGSTIRAVEPVVPASGRSLAELADAMASGQVSRLIVLGANPAYTAPADLDFPALLRRVPLTVHLGSHRDETAAACHWHIPESHALESWGDLRAYDGTVGLRQPAAVPVRPGRGAEDLLGLLAGDAGDAQALVRATWREAWGDAFEQRWGRVLEDGIVPDTASAPLEVTARTGWDQGRTATPPMSGLDVIFAPDPSVWDGRYTNNGWLQELPKPLTKQVWGNAALIGPDTATSLALSSGDAVDLTIRGRVLRVPVFVLPGHAPGAVTLPLGYGRQRTGRLGNEIGFDAYRVRTSGQPWIAEGEMTPAGERIAIVTTQHHHALQGRDIVRVTGPDQPAEPAPALPSLYPEWTYEGHAWGMAIDLDACIGCNACVIACQAENNIAVVGPEEVARGREMHWLRIDRYHAGDPADPATYFQPVPCMHCENAPCEVVCPVNATVHSSEGLNDMVYNRCIGTRTCSNNCPYKVRRFNFFDYQDTDYASAPDVMNPQVSVRERGVMEKCTYCVHRIGAARADANIDDRRLQDGEVITACQQACPTSAIVFGDVNDPESAVSRLKRNPRNYALLGHLNTRPRTTYLARIETDPPGG